MNVFEQLKAFLSPKPYAVNTQSRLLPDREMLRAQENNTIGGAERGGDTSPKSPTKSVLSRLANHARKSDLTLTHPILASVSLSQTSLGGTKMT